MERWGSIRWRCGKQRPRGNVQFGIDTWIKDVAEIIVVAAPCGVQGIEKDGREASEFAAGKPFGTDVSNHVLRDGVGNGEFTSENLVTDKMPTDPQMARGAEALWVLGNLESSRGIDVVDAGNGTNTQEFEVA